MIKRRTFLLTLLLQYAKFYDENIFSKSFTLSSGQIHKMGRLTRLADEFFLHFASNLYVILYLLKLFSHEVNMHICTVFQTCWKPNSTDIKSVKLCDKIFISTCHKILSAYIPSMSQKTYTAKRKYVYVLLQQFLTTPCICQFSGHAKFRHVILQLFIHHRKQYSVSARKTNLQFLYFYGTSNFFI